MLVDGEPGRASHRCREGQSIRIAIPDEPGSFSEDNPPTPEPIPLTILHEDAHLVAVDKPAGLVTHPGPGHRSGTLVNALVHRYPEMLAVGPCGRPGIVHRLDRGTSGALIAARSPAVHRALTAAFAERSVKKRYLALVLGRFEGERFLDRPIGRDPTQRERFRCGGRNAREARTTVFERETLPLSTLVELELHTGRTHQARVHLAGAGFPVAGDLMYGPGAPRRGGGRPGAILRRLTRPALHALRVGFRHPVTGKPFEVEARVPDDLDAAFAGLREAGAAAQTRDQ